MTPLPPQRPRLYVVPPAPPPRPRRIEVRFHVLDGRSAYGRSRAFHLLRADLDELIDHALRLEARA